MTRLTNFVILSYSLLDDNDNLLNARGTHTIAIMSGSECYASIKANFKDSWDEINKVIADGKVAINQGQEVPVEIYLGGDYKFLLLASGRSAANSIYACLWCKIHKDQRWDMSKPGDFYSKPPMAFTLADVKKHATLTEFCCITSLY